MVKTKKQLGSITFKTVNFKIIGPVLESGLVVERVAKVGYGIIWVGKSPIREAGRYIYYSIKCFIVYLKIWR